MNAALPHPDALVPEWASGWGQDRFGLYADFELAGVTQRMRWILPGRFLMGSPQDEAERFGDEVQHPVELSSGFWLAETACTQGLWAAVLGKNPSHFTGDDRPVEQVSWEDCLRFMERAEELSPGLGLRLPSEAEWEYACRAGTSTPFWFGERVTAEQVNYDGNYPYAGGEKGLDRGRTVAVKSLPPNGWGLYEMHGNVWEWCSDWQGPYGEGLAVDPTGPAEGTGRVIRGGSWFLHRAGLARSAQRHAHVPGFRLHSLGLRLARGRSGGVEGEAAGRSRWEPGAEPPSRARRGTRGGPAGK